MYTTGDSTTITRLLQHKRQTDRQTDCCPPLTRASPADTGLLPSCQRAEPPPRSGGCSSSAGTQRCVKLLSEPRHAELQSGTRTGPPEPSRYRWYLRAPSSTALPGGHLAYLQPSRVPISAGAGTRDAAAAAWIKRLTKLYAGRRAGACECQSPSMGGCGTVARARRDLLTCVQTRCVRARRRDVNVTPATYRMFWCFVPRWMMGNGVEEGEERRKEGPPFQPAQVTNRLNLILWLVHTGCKMLPMDTRVHA